MIPNGTETTLLGVRYIGAGARAENGKILLDEVPGNALGAYLDGTGAAAQLAQLPVLAGGAVLYALLTWAAFRTAAARFEKVDL